MTTSLRSFSSGDFSELKSPPFKKIKFSHDAPQVISNKCNIKIFIMGVLYLNKVSSVIKTFCNGYILLTTRLVI